MYGREPRFEVLPGLPLPKSLRLCLLILLLLSSPLLLPRCMFLGVNGRKKKVLTENKPT
jgi:hypothetical protein